MKRALLSSLSYFLAGTFSIVLAVYISGIILRPSLSQAPGTVEVTSSEEMEPSTTTEPLSQEQTLSQPVEQAASGSSAEQLQRATFLEPYIFDTRQGRRNPFQPGFFLTEDAPQAGVIGPTTPLERFEIDDLKLIGIMWDIRTPRAMFQDPNNEIHVLGKDDRIGRRRGYIATIREGEVVVVEANEFGGDQVFSTRVIRIDK